MSASLQPLTLEEFLQSQEERYEFDGIQPVAMTGGSRAAFLASRHGWQRRWPAN